MCQEDLRVLIYPPPTAHTNSKSQKQEEADKALEQLNVVLGVCTAFKDAYATYK